MKKVLIILIAILIASCSDDATSPDGMAQVEVISNFENSTVYKLNTFSFKNVEIDSLVVNDFRILISRLKLGNGSNEQDLKLEPLLIKADSTRNLYFVSKANVPEGDYDKIKFEIHRFSESERTNYVGDTLFGDFATEDKNTIIIRGIYYIEGDAIEFNFTSDQTENLSINFKEKISLSDDNLNTLLFDIDPTLIFLSENVILEPNTANQKIIEKNIHKGIVILKK
jgi:hypothetical protein